MPSLEDLENLALFGTGVGVGRSPRATGKAFVKAGRFAARRYPIGIVALGLWEAYKRGYLSERDWRTAAEDLKEGLEEQKFLGGAEVGPLAGIDMPTVKRAKRKITKANKAFKEAYKAVKPRVSTKKGRQSALAKASKIASRANPATKSKIGKGKSKAQKLARKIRKSIWGITKRI